MRRRQGRILWLFLGLLVVACGGGGSAADSSGGPDVDATPSADECAAFGVARCMGDGPQVCVPGDDGRLAWSPPLAANGDLGASPLQSGFVPAAVACRGRGAPCRVSTSGYEFHNTLDDAGRTLLAVGPDGRSVRYGWDADGRLAGETAGCPSGEPSDCGGGPTSLVYEYDAQGRLVAASGFDAAGAPAICPRTWQYDEGPGIVTEQRRCGGDARGEDASGPRPDPFNGFWAPEPSASGPDAGGTAEPIRRQSAIWRWDPASRLPRLAVDEDGDGRTETCAAYAVNPLGDRAYGRRDADCDGVADDADSAWVAVRDARGRPLEWAYPDGDVPYLETHRWDAAGELLERTEGADDGEPPEFRTIWTRDEEERPLRVVHETEGSITSVEFWSYAREGVPAPDPPDLGPYRGAVLRCVVATESAEGRLLSETTDSGCDGSVEKRTTQSWDGAGHLLERVEAVVEGEYRRMTYAYDESGRLVLEVTTRSHGGGEPYEESRVVTEYDGDGQLVRRIVEKLGGEDRQVETYGPDGRLLVTESSMGGTVESRTTFEYDEAGRQRRSFSTYAHGGTYETRWDTSGSKTAETADWEGDGRPDVAIAWTWAAAGRLAAWEWAADGVPFARRTFALDDAGRPVTEELDIGADGPIDVRVTRRYGEDGTEERTLDRDADGLPESRWTTVRDNDGRPLRTEVDLDDDGTVDFWREETWDAAGRPLTRRVFGYCRIGWFRDAAGRETGSEIACPGPGEPHSLNVTVRDTDGRPLLEAEGEPGGDLYTTRVTNWACPAP